MSQRNPGPGEPPNIINHVFIVGDMSPSMSKHKAAFIRVFDNFVAHLAQRSQENGQETRISAYLFAEAGTERCVIWDKDVLRMPSIAGYYDPQYYGMTALIDATMLAAGDVTTEISQKYGDHAVWVAVITDGKENHSRKFRSPALRVRITGGPENETFTCFVPDQTGVFEAKTHGFPADNIAIWDVNSTEGVERMGEALRDASDAYMAGRAQGIRGYNEKSGYSGSGLFRVRNFTADEVVSKLTPLPLGSYVVLSVPGSPRDSVELRPFIQGHGLTWVKGENFYQPTKAVKLQDYKRVIIEYQGLYYTGTGDEARQLLGLPDHDVTVNPGHKQGMTVFFESDSVNRKLFGGTRLVVRL